MVARSKPAGEVTVSASLPAALFQRLEAERCKLHEEVPEQKFSRSTLVRHFLSVALDQADAERRLERRPAGPPRTRTRARR